MKRLKTVTPKELLDWGLIFEINRSVLHPLGLAIAVEMTEKGEVFFSNGVWDSRDDPEGIIFAKDAFERGDAKYQNFMDKFGTARCEERTKVLGYTVQTTAEQGKK